MTLAFWDRGFDDILVARRDNKTGVVQTASSVITQNCIAGNQLHGRSQEAV
jgi:hypothetical protein